MSELKTVPGAQGISTNWPWSQIRYLSQDVGCAEKSPDIQSDATQIVSELTASNADNKDFILLNFANSMTTLFGCDINNVQACISFPLSLYHCLYVGCSQ